MNPIIIIPTYWSNGAYVESADVVTSYDHMTAIGKQGELPRCLQSLCSVREICRIALLVVSEPSINVQATNWVSTIAASFRELDIVIIGAEQINALHARLEQIGLGEFREAATLQGYGSVRNLGLLVTAILGHTEAIFLDDDELITDPDFLEKALYGLGKMTKRGLPVLAKTGYYLDRQGSWEAREKRHWYNMFWKQGEAFNRWIRQVMRGSRLAPSNSAYGGCLALHYEAFRRVAFDPWIARGEDLDYLLNLKMYGFDVWFDNIWSLRHLPPESPSEAKRFEQDIYRWMYEYRKIEYGRTQIDLLPVKPNLLDPYPGPFLESSVKTRIRLTAFLRAIARPEHQHYFKAGRLARKGAAVYADLNCSRYFRFQYRWPELVASLEKDEALAAVFISTSSGMSRPFTGRFDQISPDEEQSRLADTDRGAAASIADRWARRPTKDRQREGNSKKERPQHTTSANNSAGTRGDRAGLHDARRTQNSVRNRFGRKR